MDIKPALRHLEAALEASCASLMALEATSLADGHSALDESVVKGQIGDAIVSVREAMSELRALHEVEASVLSFGFVLADREWSRTPAPDAPPERFS
jgi:hypothetical protein